MALKTIYMKYDLSNENELIIFNNQVAWLVENQKKCNLEKVSNTRTLNQNSALHKYFELISDKLNDMSMTFSYTGLRGSEYEMRYTPNLVKEMIIKPIMLSMYDIDTTTKLTTEMINNIIDVMNSYFSTRGEHIPFPSIQSLVDYYSDNML